MWTHRITVTTAIITFLLVIAGGLVHGTGASLACPDWPTCYGSFMPPMEGLVFYEHGHRLIATLVGILTIAILVSVWKSPYRKLGIALLVIVVFQGVLGGLTVIFKLPPAISIAHLSTSMVFFSLMIAMAFLTREALPSPVAPHDVRRVVLASGIAVYAQIVLGATVRHTHSGLACMGFPLCGESAWPFGAVFIHMMHRAGSVVVTACVIWMTARIVRNPAVEPAIRNLAKVTAGVMAAQVTLGILSVFTHLELFTVTSHLGIGAILLACHVSLWMLACGRSGSSVNIGDEARTMPQGAQPSPVQ